MPKKKKTDYRIGTYYAFDGNNEATIKDLIGETPEIAAEKGCYDEGDIVMIMQCVGVARIKKKGIALLPAPLITSKKAK